MLEVLYQDDWLVAIEKPPGLMVHRSELDRHETRFAVQLLREQLGRPVWPVHRLDRGTSGVLLFALDAATAAACGQAFERDEVKKTYLAVVRGWPEAEGLIDYPLSRQPDPYERRARDPGPPQAARTAFTRLAITELPVCVDRYPASRYALLRLAPETGRRHQLRRHLKHIAHPIIGDATHGKGVHNRFFAQEFGCERLLLAAVSLGLRHPVSGAPLRITTGPGESFVRLLQQLGWPSSLPELLGSD